MWPDIKSWDRKKAAFTILLVISLLLTILFAFNLFFNFIPLKNTTEKVFSIVVPVIIYLSSQGYLLKNYGGYEFVYD